MAAPQILMLGFLFVSLLASAYLHDKPKREQVHNFWSSLWGVIIFIALLTWGGFFN